MGKQEQKLMDGVRPFLDAGEAPLVALIAQAKGTTKGIAGTGALGAAGGALMGGGERRAAHEAAAAADLVVENPCAIVLTNRRLLTVKIGAPIGLGLGGKVKSLLSGVPVQDVHSVEVKKIALRQNITLHVRDQTIQLEATAAASGKELAERVQALKG
jgi:hypothetical protein